MGKSIAEVLGRLQVSIDEYESRITSGTVESISPLRIRKDKLLITEDYIVRSSPVDYIGLKVGQEVALLQANRQQTYYILDILNEPFSDKIIKNIDDRVKELEETIVFPSIWTIGGDGYWYKDGVKTSTKATGDVWTISEDGYWIKNGVKTAIKAVGEEGRGISLVKGYYAINNDPLVAPPTGWLDEPIPTTNDNRYLWYYEKITFTDGEATNTAKRVISVRGADGEGFAPTDVRITGGELVEFLVDTKVDANLEVTGTLNAVSQTPYGASQIGASDNLNDYKTPGFYYKNTNSGATSSNNYPINKAGALIVTKHVGITQMYYPYDGGGIWSRVFQSSWKPWEQVVTIVEKGEVYQRGEYIKYSDGTMICFGTVPVNGGVVGGGSVILPASFLFNTYVVTASVNGFATSDFTRTAVVETLNSTASAFKIKVTLLGATTIAGGGAVDLDYVAIGRWK